MKRLSVIVALILLVPACGDDPLEPPPPEGDESSKIAASVAPPPCTKSWASGIGGYWSDASRWTPAGVPSNTDDVCIDAPGTYDVTHTQQIAVQSLRIGGTGANVNFEFDPPMSGIGIDTDGGIWIERGSTLTVLSKGEVELKGGAGNLTIDGELDIENSCACGGDVAILDFVDIDNYGRMELEAPVVVNVGDWRNGSGSVVVTSGTGVVDVRGIFDTKGTIVGSTVIEAPEVYWRAGTIGSVNAFTSVVHAKGMLGLVGDSQQGAINGSADGSLFELLVQETLGAGVVLDIDARFGDAIGIERTGPPQDPAVLEGTLGVSTNGLIPILFTALTNRGTIDIRGTGSIDFRGRELINEGLITTWGSDLSVQYPNTILRNRGDIDSFPNPVTLTMGASTEFIAETGSVVDGSVELVLDGATLRGTGAVGPVTALAASIRPGDPVGTLSVDELSLDASSELGILVTGTDDDEYSRIDVMGDITYGGTFRLVGQPGPALGQCGSVITPIDHRGSATGAFSTWQGLLQGPNSNWREQVTPDSLMLAGFDPAAQTITVKNASAVAEGGATDQYSVCLGPTPPAATVVVQPISNGQLVGHAPLTFDLATWRLPTTLSIEALDDLIVEPLHQDTVQYSFLSGGSVYTGFATNQTTVTITDNDGNTDLELVLQNSPTPTVGSVFELVYRVTNYGPTLSTGATLTVDPQGATNIAFQEAFGATCIENSGGVLTCSLTGQSVSAQTTVAIVFQSTAAGAITFDAAVVSQQPDPNTANDSALAAVVVN